MSPAPCRLGRQSEGQEGAAGLRDLPAYRSRREGESERRPREEKEQARCWGEGLFPEEVNNVIVDLISKS